MLLLVAVVVGCGWLEVPPCRDPILVAVVPEVGNPWWLSYECFWWGDDIVVSAEGHLTTGDWSSFPQSCHVAPVPEAMVAVGDRVLMAAEGQAYVLSRAGEALAAEQVGACPQDVRQMVVIPPTSSGDAVGVAILAGGQYQDGQLTRAGIFLATLKGGLVYYDWRGPITSPLIAKVTIYLTHQARLGAILDFCYNRLWPHPAIATARVVNSA